MIKNPQRVIVILALGITLAVSGCTAWSGGDLGSTETRVEGETEMNTNTIDQVQATGDLSISERLAENYSETEAAEPLDGMNTTDAGVSSVEPDDEPAHIDNDSNVDRSSVENDTANPSKESVEPASDTNLSENASDSATIDIESTINDNGSDGILVFNDSNTTATAISAERKTTSEGNQQLSLLRGEMSALITFPDTNTITTEVVDSNTLMFNSDSNKEYSVIIETGDETIVCEITNGKRSSTPIIEIETP